MIWFMIPEKKDTRKFKSPFVPMSAVNVFILNDAFVSYAASSFR